MDLNLVSKVDESIVLHQLVVQLSLILLQHGLSIIYVAITTESGLTQVLHRAKWYDEGLYLRIASLAVESVSTKLLIPITNSYNYDYS